MVSPGLILTAAGDVEGDRFAGGDILKEILGERRAEHVGDAGDGAVVEAGDGAGHPRTPPLGLNPGPERPGRDIDGPELDRGVVGIAGEGAEIDPEGLRVRGQLVEVGPRRCRPYL